MRGWDKLRQASGYVRKLRRSLASDGYLQYKRWRIYERKQADRDRERAKEYAEGRGEKAARAREYEERFAREREGAVARERTEQAGDTKPDR